MAKSFPLQALFQAIHRSVVKATRVAQDASLKSLQKDYFTEVHDESGKPTGTLKPKTVVMTLPHQEGPEIKKIPYEVPLFALVKHQAMTIDELEMDFEVELHGLEQLQVDDDEDETVLSASTSGGAFSRKTIAKVRMKFKGDDPPEGVLRLNDKVLKIFPG
jgi:hypothetical protein